VVNLATRLALTVEEAAQAVGVSERHLRSLLPEIPHTHLGARVVIPVEGFRRWLEERSRAQGSRVDATVQEILADLSK
jgi:excisionase family DNA binding protein